MTPDFEHDDFAADDSSDDDAADADPSDDQRQKNPVGIADRKVFARPEIICRESNLCSF